MTHHHPHPKSDKGLVAAIFLNVLLTAAEVAGGLLAGSLSLVADALHNLSDAATLGLALAARRIARRPADKRRTFGYRRAEVIGALINLTVLILLGIYLIYQAVLRWFAPSEVGGWLMIGVSCLALAVDTATAAVTYAQSRGDMNVKAAFVHNVSDALGTLAVIVAGVLIVLYELDLADPIATLLIAGYMLWQGFKMMSESIRILMESVPEDVSLDALAGEATAVEGVRGFHHVHVWQLDEHHRALEAHVVTDAQNLGEIEAIKRRLKEMLRERYGVGHTSLEFETPEEAGRSGHERGTVTPH